jgi:hypothetical protein
MNSTPSTARSKRTRASRADGDQRSSGTRRAAAASIPTVSAEQRHTMIAESAYRRAEKRGFAGGDPIADWLESEKEVDALLSRTAD